MKRRRPAPPSTLPESVLDVLVAGWDALRHPTTGYNPWPALVDVGLDEWPTLYAAHRDAIEAEASRRGLARSWAAEHFGAED